MGTSFWTTSTTCTAGGGGAGAAAFRQAAIRSAEATVTRARVFILKAGHHETCQSAGAWGQDAHCRIGIRKCLAARHPCRRTDTVHRAAPLDGPQPGRLASLDATACIPSGRGRPLLVL